MRREFPNDDGNFYRLDRSLRTTEIIYDLFSSIIEIRQFDTSNCYAESLTNVGMWYMDIKNLQTNFMMDVYETIMCTLKKQLPIKFVCFSLNFFK